MSDIYVKAAATLHELFAQRKEIAAQAGKKLRSSGKNAKKKMRTRWERAQGYLLSALLGSILTLIAINSYAGKLDSIHDTAAEDSETEQQRAITVAETVAAAKTAKQDSEARELARLLYCMVPNHSREDQEAVCWCAINRAESSLYPDTIAGVVQQPSQWVGYSADAPVIAQYYDIAQSVLSYWRSGEPRPVTPDFLWLDWSKTGVELRNSFEITKDTRYWHG